MSQILHQPAARVVLFTADACISAHIATGGERVKDALNSVGAILELSNITYSNPDRPGLPLVDYPSGVIRKADVASVIVLSEPPSESLKKFGVYVQKRPVAISVLVPGMVIVGNYHTQGRFDPNLLLTDPPEPFIPLTDAGVVRARSTTPTAVAPERLTIFVNRAHVTGIFLAEQDDVAYPTEAANSRQDGANSLRPGTRSTGMLPPAPARATGPLSAPVAYGSGHTPARGTGTLTPPPPPPGTGPFRPLNQPAPALPEEPPRGTGRLRRFTSPDGR